MIKDEDVARLVKDLFDAKKVVVLSGAGMSVGIGPGRGPGQTRRCHPCLGRWPRR